MSLLRNPTGNVIIFIIVCAGILLAIGMCAIQLAMYFGGSGQLSGAVDAGALTVGKHAAQAEVILDDGNEKTFFEYADRNSEGVSTTEVNQILSKALLIQMNEAQMERSGTASAESKDHAATVVKTAFDLAGKLAAKVSDSKNWQSKFEQAANSNTMSFLGSQAKITVDPGNGWATSFVDRGEESNISFDPQQLPDGFNADTVGIKKGDKYYFKGYTPIVAGDKTLYLVPFKPDGQPHLISGKTFDANVLAKKPFKDWEKPFPNAMSCQGKSLNDSKQVFQARSFAQINPNGSKPLQITGWVRINFDQNVAHWYVNGSPAEVPNRNEMLSKIGSSIGSLLGSTSKALSQIGSMTSGLGDISRALSKAMEEQRAKGQAANPNGTPAEGGSASSGGSADGAAPPAGGVGGGGVASISGGPPLNKPLIDKELADAAKLITDNGAGLSNAGHLITDNGAGIVTDNGAGLISNKGGGIVTDNGAGLQKIANLITDNGAGLTGGRRSLMSVGEGNNNSTSLAQKIELATSVLGAQKEQLTSMLGNLQKAAQQPDNVPHGPETFYGFAPEQQNRTFPLGTGSLFVQAFLGNEYKDPANLYTAICGLGGDYKELKRVLGQRFRELNPEYKDDDFKDIFEKCRILTGCKTYIIHYDKEEKKWISEPQRDESRLRNADGFEKEIGKDSQTDKPNWVIATPTGIGASPLPSKATARGTFYWKPGTGYNGCLGELRVKRETDIYANGIVRPGT